MLTGREALIKNGDAPDARIHQLESEVAMLREELRIISARMRRVPSHRRPQYTGLERMAILQRAPCAVGTNRKRVVTSWSPTTRSETGCAESTMTRAHAEDQTAFERELELIIDWHNEHRPHETIGRQDAQRSARLPPTLSFPTQTSVKAEAGFFASPETSFVERPGECGPP